MVWDIDLKYSATVKQSREDFHENYDVRFQILWDFEFFKKYLLQL